MILAMCAPLVLAQTDEHDPTSDHEATHEFHRNIVAGFVGVTHEGRRDNGFALGIAYERLLTESFGIGVIAEHTFGDFDFWVYAVPFAYRAGRWFAASNLTSSVRKRECWIFAAGRAIS